MPKNMGLQESAAFDKHEFVISLTDRESGLDAIIAIHSTVRGPAHGGTRMKVYDNHKDALEDALNLSQAMSYKSALVGLPYGGAKGVIILSGKKFDRQKILQAYAKKLNQLGGLFQTGTDVGLTDKDTAYMARLSPYILGLPKPEKADMSTSSAAAKGVFLAMKTAVKYKFNRDDLSGLTIGVKGVGKLGGNLVDLLLAEDARLLVADIDEDAVKRVSEKHPEVEIIDHRQILAADMDIYAPCALGHEFEISNVEQLKCSIIVGGANNQLINDAAGEAIHDRGILYIPDYVANAGGLIFVCEDLEKDGFHAERVERRLQEISLTLGKILKQSEKTGLPVFHIADMIAHERILESGQ